MCRFMNIYYIIIAIVRAALQATAQVQRALEGLREDDGTAKPQTKIQENRSLSQRGS